MNQPTQDPLGGFEQRLLRELRQVVLANSWVSPEPRRPAASGRFARVRLPLALAGAAAAALAFAIAVGLPGGGQPSKAWAVDQNPDGTVTVRIDSLSDAAGLERELNDAGVPALVQYLPPGKTCAGAAPLPGPPPGGGAHPKANPSAPGTAGARGAKYRLQTQSRGNPPGPVTARAPSGEYGLQAGDKAGKVTETKTESKGQPPSGSAPGDGQGGSLSDGLPMIEIKDLSDGGIEFTVESNPHSTQTLVIRNQSLAPGQLPEGQASHGPEQGEAAGGSAGGSAIAATLVEGKAEPCKVVDSPAQ
jgi:hypothetical protein